MTHLEKHTPSEAVYAQYDEHADRYEPGGSPPSQEGQLEMEYLKTPQYTRNNGQPPEPRRCLLVLLYQRRPQQHLHLNVLLLGAQHRLLLGHGWIGGVLQLIIQNLSNVNTWDFPR